MPGSAILTINGSSPSNGPANPQHINRFAYVTNNPLRYTDPTGHWLESAIDIAFIAYDLYDIHQNGLTWTNGLALAADVASLALPAVAGGGALVRAAAHGDEVVDAVRAADTVDDGAHALREVPQDLYAFGNTQGPRPPRTGRDVFPDASGHVGPEQLPFPNGASTFGDPAAAPLTGHYHRLPQGTQLPDGLHVVADGVDVHPRSPHPPTHHTIYPSQSMPYESFVEKFTGLPWEYAGKK